MKKFLFFIFFLFFILVLTYATDDYLKVWELTREDIQDAVYLGRILARWEALEIWFNTGLYSIVNCKGNPYLNYNFMTIDIYTPFRNLVESSKMYFYANETNLPEEQINEITSKKELKILLVVESYEKNFADECSLFIKIGNKIIIPIETVFTEPIELESIIPQYHIFIEFIFSLKDIPRQKASIMLIKDSKLEEYEIDLSELK